MIKTALFILILLFIVRMIAFFAGSETAYLSITRIKLRQMVRAKKKNAKTAEKLRNNMDELLTVILIGINFLNTLGSSLATAIAISIAGNSGVGIATFIFTFLSVVFGEIVPKTVAARYTEQTVCHNSVLLLVLEKIFFPVVAVFSGFSKATAHLARKFFRDDQDVITEEELKTLIELGETEGTLESTEKNLLYKIFKFNDLAVHDIMKHRYFVRSVWEDASRKEVLETFVDSGLSILPVYADSKDSIVGAIHYKAVLFGACADENEAGYAKKIMKIVMFVPETYSALELLAKFKKERTEFAVALNEQGEMAGIATVDDILRVVFSRMTDEDNSRVAPEQRIKFVSGNEFIVPGDMALEDVNAILKLDLESDMFQTLGGWLLEKFDRLPSTGEIFYWQNVLFVIEDQAQRRIRQVRIRFRGVRAVRQSAILH